MSISVSPANNKMSTASFDDLPEETTVKILIRLPVKDIIRSTSVNKTWYSLINNPSFISAQISRSFSQYYDDDNAVLIIPPITSNQNYCSLISSETSSLMEKFDIPFDTKSRSLKLVAQVHGLLLLTDLHMHYASIELYLWNPYVRRHRVLVSTCFKKLIDNRNMSYYVVGMGFDKLSNDYKVVRIIYVRDDKGMQFGEVSPKVEIYSLRKNTWRKIKDPQVPRLAREDAGTYFDGSFYWLEMKQPGTEEFLTYYGKQLRIMSFDFDKEVFGEFKVPDDVPENLGKRTPLKLMKFEGSLALCVLDTFHCSKAENSYPYNIWLMKEKNGVVSWTLRFKVILKKYGPPLSITKNGTLIIEAICSGRTDLTSIVSCNLKSLIHKDHGFGKHGGPEAVFEVCAPSTVATSFPESLIMYKGGKSL